MAGIAKRATIEMPIKIDQDKLRSVNNTLNRITKRSSSFTKSFQDASKQLGEFNDRADEFGRNYKDMMERVNDSNRGFARESRNMSDQFNRTQKDMQDALDKTRQQQRENADASVEANKRISSGHESVGRSIDNNHSKMDSMNHAGHSLMMTGMNMTMAFSGFTAAAKQGIQEATNLQDQYNKVRILAHNGGEQPQEARRNTGSLQRQGEQLSTSYGIDQSQISQGNEDLIRRGYTTSAARGSQPEYAKAALASGDDYNDVLKTGAGSLEAFNQRSNNTQQMHNNTKRMLNQLTYGADLTASDYKDLGWAMQYVGSTAHNSHQSSNQTISDLGELSQQNITGSRAGTSLRRVIEGLSNPKQNTLKSIGMNASDLQDSHGNLKSISDDMQVINDHVKGMTGTQRYNIFKSLFGMQGEQAAQILSGNTKQIDNLNRSVKNAPNMNSGSGYNTSVAAQNMKSFKGQSNIAKQNFKDMETSTANAMLPDLAKIVGWANNIFRKINGISSGKKRLVGWSAVITGGIGPATLGLGALLASVRSIYHAMQKVRSIFSRRLPSTATNSALEQAGENSTSSSLMNGSSNSPRLSRPRSNSTSSEIGSLSNDTRDASSLSKDTNEAGTVERDVGDVSRSSRLLSGLGKFGNIATVVSSAIPLLSSLNGKNVGSNIGNSGATIASSFIPYIGPFIAPIIGNQVGKVISGSGIGKSINSGIYRVFHGTPDKQPPKVNGTDNNLLNNFNNDFSQAQIRNSARENKDNSQSAQAMVKQNQSIYSQMERQLDEFNQKRKSKSQSSLDYLKSIHAINGKDTNKQSAKSDDERTAKAQKALKQLSNAESSNGAQRERAMMKAQRAVSNAMGNGADTQKSILNQLRHSTRNISNGQASQLIGSSYKTMRSAINNANNTYEKIKNAANKRRNTTVSAAKSAQGISSEQRKRIISNANRERNKTVKNAADQKNGIVGQAKDQHKQVVNQAAQQSKDHLKYVNQETGSIQTSWSHLWDWLKKAWNWFNKIINDLEYHPTHSFHDIAELLNGGFGDVNIGGNKNTTPSNGTKGWTNDVRNNLKKLHLSTSQSMVNRVLRQIQTESGGNANAIGGNDGNPLTGNATGLMQTKPGTFSQYGRKGGNIKNGNDSIYAGLNYAKHTYGNNLSYLGNGHGYGNGGWSSQPAVFGELSGQPEVAINPKRSSADRWIGEAINARAKADSSSKWAKFFSRNSLRKQGSSLDSNIKGMQNQSSQSKQQKPIVINQSFNVSGNADKTTVNNISQTTKQAVKQVIDEYFGEKNDAIFNS